MISMGARKKLLDMEQEILQKTGSKEQALLLRPPKGKDYAIHFADIILGGAKEALEYAEIRLKCDNNGSITDFSYEFKDQGQAG